MKLSDGVEAAIHCTATLAGLDRNVVLPAADMAAFFGVSPSYLVKHLKALVGAGILASVPGPRGGYKAARAAADITLLDIVLAVEGDKPAFRCAEIRRRGPGAPGVDAYPSPCGIKVAMLRAESAYRDALRQTRLSDIIQDYQENSDPRVIAHGCAAVAKAQRPQG